MIRRVLIANRGEIARRIIRTCRAMGIGTVAVYSDADTSSLHVREADRAERIGAAAATQSYLNIEAMLAAAARSGADAVHPGYGFLSERAEFAEACHAAGLVFIGPPAAVIRRMGSKTEARATMIAAGVPVVPGATPASQEPADIRAAINEVGLPVLLKASAGGGGKGMRIIRKAEDIDEAMSSARSEATRAFGDGALYIERLVERARHVEVQVFGDTHGNVVHVMERDCSLQRRHQKVIEEAPAPHLAPAVRARLLAAAVAAARAVGYINAGTIEFLVEGEGEAASFYFLEMNTRLQVEHPVTEAITGLDLVRAQLLVASGEPLPFRQEEVVATGHAVECRIYAEDSRKLLPQSGRLLKYCEPAGPGIRVDAGVREGDLVSVHYDPLIAKLIVHAPERSEALDRMAAALADYDVLGLRHNLAFLRTLVNRRELREGRVHTRFIESHFDELTAPPPREHVMAAVALAAYVATRDAEPVSQDADDAARLDPFDVLGRVDW